jgi:very-short-patch-repair endonuclease
VSLEYDKGLIPNAKALRKNLTPQERKLWYDFLAKYPVRFQRQKVIDRYIADFYCASAQLVVEVDGGGHYTDEQQGYDAQRTAALKEYGLLVIRFTNLDVMRNFEGVCFEIDKAVKARKKPPSDEGGGRRLRRPEGVITR